MNTCSNILEEIRTTRGSIAKAEIIKQNADNMWLQKILRYGLDQMMPFHVVKVPKVLYRNEIPLDEESAWKEFFTAADECASRKVTGNSAINLIHACFQAVTPQDEKWMRKILQKRLALGVGIKSINKIYPNLIPTFEVSLAQKFDTARTEERTEVAIEPKLDGIRCFTIVRNGTVQMLARSGKPITNFENSLSPELIKLGDGCYDGELMGQDFTALMRQAYRKTSLDTEGTYLALFDFLPLKEWDTKDPIMTCEDRYEELLDRLDKGGVDLNLIQPVERLTVQNEWSEIKLQHDTYVAEGYEGAMIKFLDAPYKFGRGYEVMKLKAFHDADLIIERLEEGTGRHEGRLGAVVVSHKGVSVRVGSGFSDDLRVQIWNDPESFIGRMIEVRYQEETPDGSLRFPTFVCFRNDR